MKTPDQVLEILENRIDKSMLESYITREWLRPVLGMEGWYFEEIDIARVELICHLSKEIEVNDEGIDVVLSLLDQLYGLRVHIQKLARAVTQQPPQVQTEIMLAIKRSGQTE